MIDSSPFIDRDRALALLALVGAVEAGAREEVPVGAVLSDSWGRLLAQGGNNPITAHDPVGHAEIITMRKACGRVGNYRLPGARMVVTLEPCPLCLEALKISRISEVYFVSGQSSENLGGLGRLSVVPWSEQEEKQGDLGMILQASSGILRFFFARRRGI